MAHAIRVHQPGGPEQLSWDEIDVGDPGPGEVRLRQTAAGLNFIDTYHRTGFYKLPLPAVIGSEGAGVVEAVGPGVSDLAPGDRVAYAGLLGGYAEVRLAPAARLVKLPDAIGDEQAAAMMLQGMTAEYLLRRTYRVQPGEHILVHAAAGGVGQILCQWGRALGAIVLGTVSTDEKAAVARAAGCHHPIVYTREDFVARVHEITSGAKVSVVYDGVGRDTFLRSFDCLRPLGMMVSFGQASGPIAPFDPLLLSQKGSLFLTRPTLFTYTASREDLLASAAALFDVVLRGAVTVRLGRTYALRDAARAHRDLEARATTGSVVLLP